MGHRVQMTNKSTVPRHCNDTVSRAHQVCMNIPHSQSNADLQYTKPSLGNDFTITNSMKVTDLNPVYFDSELAMKP